DQDRLLQPARQIDHRADGAPSNVVLVGEALDDVVDACKHGADANTRPLATPTTGASSGSPGRFTRRPTRSRIARDGAGATRTNAPADGAPPRPPGDRAAPTARRAGCAPRPCGRADAGARARAPRRRRRAARPRR